MAGSDRRVARLGSIAAIVTLAGSAWAADTATVRIGIPEGRAGEALLVLGEGIVALELPQGAVIPADVARESDGMIRMGRMGPAAEASRVRIELTLSAGALDRVEWNREGLALTFRRRSSLGGAAPTTQNAYRLGADDKIQISVAGHPELTQLAVVSPAGLVTAPLVGEMKVGGSTVAEVAARLNEALARDFMVDPKVDVQIVEYRSQWVVLTGEVKMPGRVALKGGTDLKQALAEVGGFGPEAGEEIEISRSGAGGEATTLRVDRGAYERGEQNPILEHGDLVNLPRATFAFVNGEVRAPGRLRVERGLSLLKVLAMAGGPTEWANMKSVRILPEGKATEGRDYNVRDIEDGKIADPEIRGGDVIIVRRRFL